MTQLLKTYLDIAMNSESSIQKKIIATIPKELGYNNGDQTFRVKELLLTEAIESTTLIQTEVAKTILEGAEPAKCLRQAIPTVNMNSNVLSWTVGETGTYAGVVAEAAEIPIETQDYSTVTFTALKYGVRPVITSELVEDGLFNIIELELRKSGARIENSLNRLGISYMIDNLDQDEHDTAGSDQGIKAVAAAVSTVRAAGFNPDTLIMNPEAEAKILAEFVPTNYYPTESIVNTGMIPNILGLKTFTNSIVSNGSETWGYAAGGEIGMLVFDSAQAAAIGMRKDITINQYNDPIRDLVGMSVLARFDVKTLLAKAGCRVEY